MSKSTSYNSANCLSRTTVPDNWELIPCVQYGFSKDEGPIRAPKLRTIFESIPIDATTVSPVYILTRDQYEEHQNWDNPYNVHGYTSIATKFQEQCETENRVLYPVHIESDVYHKEGPANLIDWFQGFVEERLDTPFETCTLYFSGHRSIHVHVPRFVSGERDREWLKEMAESYCEQTEAELDCGIYKPKQVFRLPGVCHAKTTLRKAEIEADWGHSRIIREASKSSVVVPEAYETVLRQVYATQNSLTVNPPQTTLNPPYDLFRVIDANKTVLESGPVQQGVETPVIEREQCPEDVYHVPLWAQYNCKEFSPYALASGGSRSVAVLKVKGSPFARKEVTGGSYERPVHALVPSFFYGARGCAGDEYTKAQEHAPLQLSKLDFEKWDYEAGDNLVVIGGKNNQSVILRVDKWQATVAGHALTGQGGNRQAALDYLVDEGYDIGKAGKASPGTSNQRTLRGPDHVEQPEKTEAAKLQIRAEREGIESLGHMERWRVACRLLLQGWEPAWQWFKAQFGPSFDSEITRDQFLSVINSFPDDYSHVDVPMRS